MRKIDSQEYIINDISINLETTVKNIN